MILSLYLLIVLSLPIIQKKLLSDKLYEKRARGQRTQLWWTLPLTLAHWSFAAIDHFVWPGSAIPFGWQVAAMVIVLAGLGLNTLAMATNPFFTTSIELQPDHRVVSSGVYGVLRHPGRACLHGLRRRAGLVAG